MKKTPPEETRIATRLPDRGAAHAGPDDARAILDMIDNALDEQAGWLAKWHRAVVCGPPTADDIAAFAKPESGRFGAWLDANRQRGLLDQPVFRQLWTDYSAVRDLGRRLALEVAGGARLPQAEYDAFMAAAQQFTAAARRIRDAFQRALSDLDPLTGVHSRQGMMADLDRERERSIRTGKTAYVALCDIDNFKSVNDTHGHLAGDAVLLVIASRLIAKLRPYDRIYRFGGDEFLLAFAEATGPEAAGIADRLRAEIAGMTVPADDGGALSVTLSFGLAPLDRSASVETSIQRADRALYRAKHEGRNRVSVWQAADGEARHG